jgi:hemoglobin
MEPFALATTAPPPAADSVPNTPFHLLGGHAVMQAICDRFYDLMDSDPAYAELRAMHAPDLTRMKTALAQFLAGWAGGPRDWFEANPGRCMMSVHKPYVISQQVAGQWADAMKRAIADVAPERADLGKQMGEILGQMAEGMGR